MRNQMRKIRAFTLIELLTVMAITAILLTIISLPLIQSFNLTRAGQAFAEAQDKARSIIDRVTREASNGAGLRDMAGAAGAIDIVVPGQNGQPERVRLLNAKLDILMPSAGEPLTRNGALLNPDVLIDPNGDPNDPNNWKEDPTMRTPKGQVTLPTATGFRMVRYFVGLRDPFAAGGDTNGALYNNPYNTILARSPGGRDNLYVLYRAEVDFKTFDRVSGTWRFNNTLFPDLDGNGSPDFDDPSFFRQYLPGELKPNGSAYSGAERTAKANLIRAWQQRARVVTELSRYDMIEPVYDKKSFTAIYDGNVPRIRSLVSFRPGRVASEPVEGGVVVRTGMEFENAEKMGADTMRTKFGAWSSALVRAFPSQLQPGTPWAVQPSWLTASPYLVGRDRYDGAGVYQGFSVFDFTSGPELTSGVETFDVSAYYAAASVDPSTKTGIPNASWYPFTYAVNQANSRSNWLSDAAVRSRFIPFLLDARTGQMKASFGIDEVGTGALNLARKDNRPVANSGDPLVPSQQIGAPTDWTQAQYSPSSPTSTINGRFNVLFNHWNTLVPSLPRSECRRFLDLRFVPCNDGTPSPLHPTLGFARARIVAGSEIVVGPNQTPGPLYGQPIRYQRVTADSNGNVNVGPNQYYINYVDRRDLSPTGYADLGFPGTSSDSASYNPSNFAYAIIQPRFKAGYLEFHSDPNTPIPDGPLGSVGNISVFYRFQFTESTDVFSVDYDTKQLLRCDLTIKNFPQGGATPTPQAVTLTGSATVRNFSR